MKHECPIVLKKCNQLHLFLKIYIILYFTCKNNWEIVSCWLCYLVLISDLVFITGFQAPIQTSNCQELTSTTWVMLSTEVILVEMVCLMPLLGEQWHPAAHVWLPPLVQQPQPGCTSSSFHLTANYRWVSPLLLSVRNVSLSQALCAVGGGASKGISSVSAACNLSLPRGMTLGMVLSSPHNQREWSAGSDYSLLNFQTPATFFLYNTSKLKD